MTELALVALLATTPAGGGVQGTVRSAATGEPIPGAEVVLLDGSRRAFSDGDGTYALERLPAGRHAVRFSGFGYHEITLEVVVPAGRRLTLDVRLDPRPIAMPTIAVRAPGAGRPAVAPPLGPAPPGSRFLGAAALAPGPLTSDPDPLAALEVVPGINLGEESPTELHVRGGSADQNLILLDGIPVYNAFHTSGVLSGVNPDAVAGVALHAGALPARFGGRLSSVIDIVTPRPAVGGPAVRGAVGLPDVRGTAEVPLPAGGGLLVAGRRTTYDLVERSAFDRRATSGFDEVLGKATLPVGEGEVDVLALHGENRLSYFADPGFIEPSAPLDALPADRYSAVRWTTDTDAITWRRGEGEEAGVRASFWRSATRSSGAWGVGEGRFRFDQLLAHLGARAEATVSRGWGRFRAGGSLERISASYATAPASPLGDAVRFDGVASTSSAFVEHRWIPHDRWLVDEGLRFVAGSERAVRLEPRIALHHRPSDGLEVSIGYARVHQSEQSLRNEESVLGAAYGFDPLVTTADPRVPTARSDHVTGSLRADLAPGLRLEVEAHARWMDGLLLVAPATPQPFAIDGFATGTGTARGVGAGLTWRGAWTEIDVVGGWSSTTRRAGRASWHPTFERRLSLAAAVARHVGWATLLRAAFRTAAGRPTSVLARGFDWEPFDRTTGEVEFGGTPLRRSASLGAERLPAYARLDIGVRRAWRTSVLGQRGSVAAWLDVLNVLGTRNVLALQETAEPGVLGSLPLRGTSVALGVDWTF